MKFPTKVSVKMAISPAFLRYLDCKFSQMMSTYHPTVIIISSTAWLLDSVFVNFELIAVTI